MGKEVTQEKPQAITKLKLFATDTSAHGVRNMVSPERNIFSRLVWTLGVLAAITMLIMTLHGVNDSYKNYNFLTNIKIHPTKKLPFPAITICNLGFINGTALKEMSIYEAMKRILLQNTFLLLPFNASVPPYSDILAMKIDTLFNRVYYNLTSSLIICSWNGQWIPCRYLFTPIETYIGRCFIFNGNSSSHIMMNQDGILSGLRVFVDIHQAGNMVYADIATGYKVLLHEPHEFPDMSSRGFTLSPGHSYSIAVKKTDFNFLTSPYKAFGDEACTDTHSPDFNVNVNYSSIYSHSACLLECVVARSSKKCRCKTMLNPESHYPCCTVSVYIACISKYVKWFYMDARENDTCNCPWPCKSTQYDVRLSSMYFPSNAAMDLMREKNIVAGTYSEIRSNYLELRVFYEELIQQEIKHVPEYTFISIMGTVGGQMGLLLGASMLTVAEFVEFLIFIMFAGCKRLWGKLCNTGKLKTCPRETPRTNCDSVATCKRC